MELADVIALISSHKWVALAALVIAFAVRLLKSDTTVPIDIPAAWRPWLALGLGIVSGVLDKIANGTVWTAAVAGGLVSALIAVFGHDIIVGSLRGGVEIPIPGLMRVTTSSKVVGRMPPLTLLALVGLVSCSAAANKQVANTAIDLATGACVTLHDDLGNGVVDSICATEEELAPIIKHLIAARKFKAANPGAGKAKVDACLIPLNGSLAGEAPAK